MKTSRSTDAPEAKPSSCTLRLLASRLQAIAGLIALRKGHLRLRVGHMRLRPRKGTVMRPAKVIVVHQRSKPKGSAASSGSCKRRVRSSATTRRGATSNPSREWPSSRLRRSGARSPLVTTRTRIAVRTSRPFRRGRGRRLHCGTRLTLVAAIPEPVVDVFLERGVEPDLGPRFGAAHPGAELLAHLG